MTDGFGRVFLEAGSKLTSSTCHILFLISLVGWVHSDSKIHDLPQEANIIATVLKKITDSYLYFQKNPDDGNVFAKIC